jgi:hypothetical protein
MRDSGSLILAAAALVLVASEGAAVEFVGNRTDHFESSMTAILDVPGLGMQAVDLSGPTSVAIGPRREEDGRGVVDTELVAMELTGTFQSQPITVRLQPQRSSRGEVRAQGTTDDFPADSFFDVFVEVDVPGLGLLVNRDPVRVQKQGLLKLPPLFDDYVHPPPAIPLVQKSNPNGPVIASIAGESSHRPEQDPTFGIAAGGSLDAAQLYGLPKPPPVRLSRAGLGLANGDDVDALSFGTDAFDQPDATTLVFSVRPGSMGAPNTGVRQQAAGGTEEGSEYVTFVDSTNQTLVPADVIVPLAQTDDLDSLTDYPAAVVDLDADLIPDRPVFFSLAPGSPSLATLGASPADVLVSIGGVPSIYAPAAALGLTASDDVDALCLMKSNLPSTTLRSGPIPSAAPAPGPLLFDAALFSLSSGSPRLAQQGHTAGDVFVTNFSNSRPNLVNTPLALYADAAQLGLLAADDLDALKCQRPTVMVEIDDRGDTDGPGNGTGCSDGDFEVALLLGLGLLGAVEDPDAVPPDEFGEPGFFEIWTVQNPAVGDYHGPYAYPGTAAASFPEFWPAVLDPLDVSFVGNPNDNCGLLHVHGPFGFPDDLFGFHPDPDVVACGHGVFVPHPFPILVIPTRRDVPTTAELMVGLLGGILPPQLILPYLVQAFWHEYDGPTTIGEPTDCPASGRKRAILIFQGLALTQANLLLAPFAVAAGGSGGGAGGQGTPVLPPIRFGPPQRVFPPPLLAPEPAGAWTAPAAAGALAALAAARRRQRGTRESSQRPSSPNRP